MILPLTDDLDRVSEELFALKTNGGEEYCGWVIRDAVKQLEWSRFARRLQGDLHRRQRAIHAGLASISTLVQSAIERGILVNTIFCGASCGRRADGLERRRRPGRRPLS